jgi:hypothetical protein
MAMSPAKAKDKLKRIMNRSIDKKEAQCKFTDAWLQ